MQARLRTLIVLCAALVEACGTKPIEPRADGAIDGGEDSTGQGGAPGTGGASDGGEDSSGQGGASETGGTGGAGTGGTGGAADAGQPTDVPGVCCMPDAPGTGGASGVDGAADAGAPTDVAGADDVSADGAVGCKGPVSAAGWVNRTPSALPLSWPPARKDMAMTFDAATGKSVMYGGYAGPFPIRDTWEWDSGPGIWTERKVSPPGVFDMAGAAYDSTRGRMLLFGGESFPTAGASRELWEWNGRLTSWTNLTPTPIPANWPSARIAPSAAYDPARRRLVVHGGDMPADRTWEWDPEGGAWFNRSVTPSPGVWPGPAFAWDERRGRGVLLIGVPVVDGGADGNFVPELWEWDGAAGQWSRRERQGGAPWPRARMSARMVFDPTVGRVLLFGGIVRQGLPLDDLWEWNGAEGRWTALEASAPSARPPARFVAGMAYDTACSRLVVFGGASLLNSTTGGPDLRDVWEWSRP